MDWSYIAGYFDGEGNVKFRSSPSRNGYIDVGLTWSNTHFASLEMMQEFMNAGRIQVRSHQESNAHKIGYQLNVNKVEDILRIGEMLYPHLIIKQEQMREMLDWAKVNRKPMSPNFGILSKTGVEEITRLYKSGMTHADIARKFNMSPGGVSSFFIRYGIKGRRTGPAEGAYGVVASHGIEKLTAMYQSGMTIDEIAQELGVRCNTVRNYFWRKGIKPMATKKIRRARANRKNQGVLL